MTRPGWFFKWNRNSQKRISSNHSLQVIADHYVKKENNSFVNSDLSLQDVYLLPIYSIAT